MKRQLSALLALTLLLLWPAAALADAGSEPDWTEYDRLIKASKAGTDFLAREDMLHQAEEMLMHTGAVLPLYYGNSVFLQRGTVSGVYNDLFGTTYFHRAEVEGSDTLHVNLGSEPGRLDPAVMVSQEEAEHLVAAFSGLYRRTADGHPQPDLATGYEMSEDGLTYTFTLREGLKWSDGTKLDAHDFEYSWKRAADPQTGAGYSYMFSVIKGYPTDLAVTASEDGRTLTVELNQPCAYFLGLAAFPCAFAVPKGAVESAPNAELNPGSWTGDAGFVCSGPFMLTRWQHDEYMEYVKNPNFWDAENVKLEKIVVMLSSDATAVYNAYLAGDLELITTIPSDELTPLKQSPELHTQDLLSTQFIAFNVKSHLFDGMTVEQASAMRRAFAVLIDRDFIIDTVAQCGQKEANCFVPDSMSDGNGGFFKTSDANYTYPVTAHLVTGEPEEGYYTLEVDVPGAIALLKEAGFQFDGDKLSAATPISFEYLTRNVPSDAATAECVQQDLAAVGIEMTIRTCENKEYLAEMVAGRFDLVGIQWGADFNDPINMLEMWTSTSGNNICFLGR